ncbi:MAG: hypothetical protein ACLPYS_14245 [Vulcanimicrobiaceae bacterium]
MKSGRLRIEYFTIPITGCAVLAALFAMWLHMRGEDSKALTLACVAAVIALLSFATRMIVFVREDLKL